MTRPTLPIPLPAEATWRGPELAGRDDWIYTLERGEIAAIERAVAAGTRAGKPVTTLSADDLPLPELAPAAARWRRDLASGRGFILLRGLPVERMSREEAAIAYWAVGLLLGSPVPQNLSGELVTDVLDVGHDPSDPSTRLYKTRAEQDFHTDGADVIGLLCLQPARAGGQSRIVSSPSVLGELQRRAPELAAALFDEFPWHYAEAGLASAHHFRRPICTLPNGRLNTFFIPWYIRRALDLPEVPPLSPLHHAALEAVEQTANDPDFYLDMDFRPGDVQLLKNSVILHKRTAYEDWPEPERRRHLLRLWLSAPDFDDGDEQLRAGIVADALSREVR